jgi:hypothetical protein
MIEARTVDVRSPVNGAHFYSGKAPDGETRMAEIAEKATDGLSSVTLEKTPGGSYFDGMKLYQDGSPVSQSHADLLWRRLSARYAENAEGEVTVWAPDPPPGGIWLSVEKPILARNPNITGVKTGNAPDLSAG